MTEHEGQRYVAYRATADEFEICFFGGPLDGARIRTDIYPDCEMFVHRVRSRSYPYRYAQISRFRFHATLHADTPSGENSSPTTRITWPAVLAIFSAFALAVAAISVFRLLD